MGFIGHHLAMSLKSAGAQVMIVDHLQVNNIVMCCRIETLRKSVALISKIYFGQVSIDA